MGGGRGRKGGGGNQKITRGRALPEGGRRGGKNFLESFSIFLPMFDGTNDRGKISFSRVFSGCISFPFPNLINLSDFLL